MWIGRIALWLGDRDGHVLVRWLFWKALACVYLVAFLSLWVQMEGLIGSRGLLPAQEWIIWAAERLDGLPWWEQFRLAPTFGWIDAGDATLHAACFLGVAASVLLLAGICPPLCAAVCWAVYLSFTVLGQIFFSYQWDALLLEAGFVAILLGPWCWRDQWGVGEGPSPVVVWLFRWLLFRLMFLSGWVKLASGDPVWEGLTALSYHFETQPLPVWQAWYLHHLPHVLLQAGCFGMFVIELVLPFAIFLGRWPRLVALAGFALLQFGILVSGNYGFFNWLTLALCIWLCDDGILRRAAGWVHRWIPPVPPVDREVHPFRAWLTLICGAVGLGLFVLSIPTVTGAFQVRVVWLEPLAMAREWMGSFRMVNSYGLFAVMTRERAEIVVEGSRDGLTWEPYEFKWKPGDVRRAPGWVAPHMPRLDWQMWFAALGGPEQNRWVTVLCRRLLEGEPEVLRLLGTNPFPDDPPAMVRALVYTYQFANPRQRKESGYWWQRFGGRYYVVPVRINEEGTLVPAVSR